MRSSLAVAKCAVFTKVCNNVTIHLTSNYRVCAYAQRDGRPRNIGGAFENHEERKFRNSILVP